MNLQETDMYFPSLITGDIRSNNVLNTTQTPYSTKSNNDLGKIASTIFSINLQE